MKAQRKVVKIINFNRMIVSAFMFSPLSHSNPYDFWCEHSDVFVLLFYQKTVIENL